MLCFILQSILCDTRVENWLAKLLTGLRISLKEQLVLGIQQCENKVNEEKTESGAEDSLTQTVGENSEAPKNTGENCGACVALVSKPVVYFYLEVYVICAY